MCGIAGFSLNKTSKVNARALSHHLLAAIEWRGHMAAGAAFPTAEGEIQIIKDPVSGSNLPLRGMPRNTKTAILHTRLATQGSHHDNSNNHPLPSPEGRIVLTHNGVIWNDAQIRKTSLATCENLPEVDSTVIPALFEQVGILGVAELSGDAAVGWLDKEDLDILHLARIESSPVAYTHLEDGSFVYASTPSLLMAGLESAGLKHGAVFQLNELDYVQVKGGVIWNLQQTPEPEGFGLGYAASWRDATSGGHGSTTNKGSFFGVTNPNAEDDEDPWTEEDARRVDAAWAAAGGRRPIFEDDDMINDPDFDENGVYVGSNIGPRFYTVDTFGNMTTYDDLEAMEKALLHKAGMTTEGFGDGKSRWVNHFQDIGSFGFDGEAPISWVDEPSEAVYHEAESLEGIGYIRDGVVLLKGMAGR